ncbi:type II toxin-antitoxin system PemK/MazF family toxin [Clostridium estertheticum]|uniref:type II toxin-antitoxin system PemK/MazF family toxin n=1 Tax=Clostridium estertheticum TaxID=238834 RepID=UPI001C0D644C|nr:type II toxin-antitoxin system PemK/MazF family toxin [Clostridium estertheticum]MBU3216670.1 type II toxin-antitoxin system PemK/MazF family toxin [Clostridium estertheticum]WAG54374.1 type II toxin-antitoxin system PemK/MazF family toxin [Clostridium estertheticum]
MNNDKLIVRRSDIFMVELVESNNALLKGNHPVLILTNKKSLQNSDLINIVPITSSINTNPSSIQIGVECGLSHNSMVLCNQVQVISKSKLGKKIGFIGAMKMDEILSCINAQFGYKNINLEAVNKQRINSMAQSIQELNRFKTKYSISDKELDDEIRMKTSELKLYCNSLNLNYKNYIEGE